LRPSLEITPPFFEVGPKAYSYGRELLRLARCADRLSEDYGVQIILTPQAVDIALVAAEVEHVLVFAQHMDGVEPGRGVGSMLAEAIQEAGAVGVLLNHSEKPLPRKELIQAVRRAAEVGLGTMICANGASDAAAIAALVPDILIAEEPELIASISGRRKREPSIAEINRAVWSINPAIRVLHAAGIASPDDVYEVVAAGAQGTGSSSAIFTAELPEAALEAMIRATRLAWDARRASGPGSA
jgi:triosephosphate isomerase